MITVAQGNKQSARVLQAKVCLTGAKALCLAVENLAEPGYTLVYYVFLFKEERVLGQFIGHLSRVQSQPR
jgi:hypothetical protein